MIGETSIHFSKDIEGTIRAHITISFGKEAQVTLLKAAKLVQKLIKGNK